VLVLAAHSDLSEAAVTELEDAGRLFHPQHRPKGHMPSESAAALLLATLAWPTSPAPDTSDDARPIAWAHRPALSRRDKSIDAPGKVQSQTLRAVMDAALGASQLLAADLAALIADADQHTPRGTELFGTTLDVLPQLDPNEDMRQLGSVCGGAGVTTPLMVLACASAQSQALDKPVLAASLGDSHDRLAVVMRASPPPQTNPPTQAP
jgi:hypothetical protein